MSHHHVVLVRHGQTAWSLSAQHTGRSDVPLTDAGEAEARQLGDRLSGWQFGRILTSPLARSAETCRLAGFGDRAEPTDDLCEWDYGDYEGRRTADIRQERPGWDLWLHGVPGGETVEEVGHRADRVIAAVQAERGDVALFAHGHLLRVLAARWIGLPPAGGRLLALYPASVSVLGWERETPVVERWNTGIDG